jgi:hypothetical protein
VWLLKIGLCPKNKSHPLGGWIFTMQGAGLRLLLLFLIGINIILLKIF